MIDYQAVCENVTKSFWRKVVFKNFNINETENCITIKEIS